MMDHLTAIASRDVDELRRMPEMMLEGVAWLVLRGKMERLMKLMDRPPKPEHVGFNLQNVDDTIEAINKSTPEVGVGQYSINLPSVPKDAVAILRHLRDCYLAEDILASMDRPDVLAMVRNLRRYLLLVEARATRTEVRVDEPSSLELGHVTFEDGDKPQGTHPDWEWSDRQLSNIAHGRAPGDNGEFTSSDVGARGSKCPACGRGFSASDQIREQPDGSYHEGCPDVRLHARTVPRYPARLEDGEVTLSPPDAYPTIETHFLGTTYWNVDRRRVPTDQRDHLPRLRLELNNTEWMLIVPEYRGMYDWTENESKWKLKPEFREHWGRLP